MIDFNNDGKIDPYETATNMIISEKIEKDLSESEDKVSNTKNSEIGYLGVFSIIVIGFVIVLKLF